MKIKLTILSILAIAALIFSIYSFKKNNSKEDKTENRGEAYDALQFISSAAAFPNVDIPADGYGKAWDYIQSNYSRASMRLQSNTEWRSIGPHNVGGRTISIAIDPVDTNIVWLGSASGGLWKSETGGHGINAWQYVETGFPILGVGAIDIDPKNTDVMYIGTGETYDYGTSVNGLFIRTTRGSNGIGILKSVDKGVTWTKSLDWSYDQRRGIWDIIINPINPNTVFAATTEGVFKSTDAGVTWEKKLNYTMVMDLALDPSDTTILYAGVGNLTSPTHGLYQTTDAGETWNKLTNGLPSAVNTGRISIDIYKSISSIVVVHITNNFNTVGLYRSFNKGLTWTLMSSSNIASIQGWYAKCLKIKDDESNRLLIGGVNLYESITSGSDVFINATVDPNLINIIPWSDMHGLISNPMDPNKIYLLTDAGLYRSNDFGATWRWCADGYNVSQYYHGSVSATDSTLGLGGLQDRNTQRYNGTLYWNPVDGGDGTFNAIDPDNPSIQYTSSQYLYMSQSTDTGYTFTPIFQGNAAAFVAPFMLAPSNPDLIYAGDESLNFSFDKGVSWSSTGAVDNFNPIISIGVSFVDDTKVYFATAPTDNFPMHVFLSTDVGLSFVDISSGLPNRYPRDIAVDPNDDNTAYVAFSGFGSGHIFKTTNNGSNWTDVSTTLPDIPFHSLLVNPKKSNIVFAGCDYGVFASTNGGDSWQTMNEGLPMAVMVFDIQYSASDNSLVIFTHGHGAYKFNLKDLDLGLPTTSSMEKSFEVYPTLTRQNLNVEFYSDKLSDNNFALVNAEGKIVFEKNIKSVVGKNKIDISIPENIATGYYWCKVSGDNFSVTRKIFKFE